MYKRQGWNSQENALVWRKAWADISNYYLERAGSLERIDHRSNAERGIDEIPTCLLYTSAAPITGSIQRSTGREILKSNGSMTA